MDILYMSRPNPSEGEDCPLSPSCSVASLVLCSPCFVPGGLALAKPAQGGSEHRGVVKTRDKAARKRKALSRAATRRRRAATQEENKQGAGNEGGKRIGTRPKEGDDVSEREEDCRTGHGGGDPRDAIPHVRSGSCVSEVNDNGKLSRPV
jgi:hypothetical protein